MPSESDDGSNFPACSNVSSVMESMLESDAVSVAGVDVVAAAATCAVDPAGAVEAYRIATMEGIAVGMDLVHGVTVRDVVV